MRNKRQIGAEKEKQVCAWLVAHGYRILKTNFCCRAGEIDIVACEEKYLVFLEVKYRSGMTQGMPEEAVDVRKQRAISRAALFYMTRFQYPQTTPVRFDVVTILGEAPEKITLYKNAFEFCGY
ncbi:MAG: YraN family protein [Eubacterium sp.]|nr:YraN family protein [Eubacterium sp.]